MDNSDHRVFRRRRKLWLRQSIRERHRAEAQHWGREVVRLRGELTTLESERLANSILTEELEAANAELKRLKELVGVLQGVQVQD